LPFFACEAIATSTAVSGESTGGSTPNAAPGSIPGTSNHSPRQVCHSAGRDSIQNQACRLHGLLNSRILPAMFKTIRFLQDARLAAPGRLVPQPLGFPPLTVCDQWVHFSKGQTTKVHPKSIVYLAEGIDFEFVDSN
jgi:hypothetical protein